MEFVGTLSSVRPLQKGVFISIDTEQDIFAECDKLKG